MVRGIVVVVLDRLAGGDDARVAETFAEDRQRVLRRDLVLLVG
jgi:hypothetical protein